ncbi:MAG: DUF4367 domain-containing protein, partial [Clostridia bacterium]|nr:DUF4367 domain-containing protein [Clostridia bacterium]
LQKLKDAFKEINSEELNNLNIPKEDFEFSERYKKNMEKLLAKQRKPYFRYFNTAGKRAVACILVVVMLFASSMTIEAVREPVVEFFVNVYEKFVEIFFGDDEIENSPDAIEEIYTLGYVPEGYEFVSREIVGDIYVQTMFKKENLTITLTQYTMQNKILMDNEEADFEILSEHNIKVAVINKSNSKILFWNTNKYAFRLTVSPIFSEDECIKLIEHIEII